MFFYSQYLQVLTAAAKDITGCGSFTAQATGYRLMKTVRVDKSFGKGGDTVLKYITDGEVLVDERGNGK